VVRFQDLWRRLAITNDDFIRTTEERHKAVVQGILADLHRRDEIYRAEYDGWYCVTCERFYMEKDLAGGKCPAEGCGRPVERVRETNYFFRMSKYQQWLVGHIRDNPRFIQPDFRRNETLGFLQKDLNDLCISRPKSRMAWGIELPFDRDFVTYVWFDALVNYISAVGYLSDETLFRRWWPATCHLIGKDILTTHTVYWPTMLKAMGLPMPETIFAHGWWLAGKDKMSKTAGNVVDPMEFIGRHGADAFRYFLMAEMSLGQDASFTEEAFTRRYNADLANDLGNMLSRVMKLVRSHCGGRIPAPGPESDEEKGLRDAVLRAAAQMVEAVDGMRLDQGLAGIAGAVRDTNRYLERRQPWALAKRGAPGELGTVLYTAAEALRIVSGMLSPVMPGKMAELRRALGLAGDDLTLGGLTEWGGLRPGAEVGEMTSLFPRIAAAGGPEDGRERKPAAAAAPAPVEGVMSIEYADFEKVDLRTARIVEAERVPNADRLLKLQIEIGGEKRQIVAGIAQHYQPETLPGKAIVVVANLKPAMIRGIQSDGMLLAAVSGGELRLVTVDGDVATGVRVK
jgi:methionyl-tRNA synthetase